jgi:hypothetical protein
MHACTFTIISFSSKREVEIKKDQSSLLHLCMNLNHQSKVHLGHSMNCESFNLVQCIKVHMNPIVANDFQ